MKDGAPKLTVDASELAVTIVVTSWHQEITEALLAGAERALKAAGNDVYSIVRVAGAFELPLAAKRLAESFRDRETEKLYWAVVVGVPPKTEGAIDLPLAKRPGARDRETMQVDHEEGLKALTHFREMDRAGRRAALLAMWPRTGRTHQLRVHLKHLGHPILGDEKYGQKISFPRLALHAQSIAFIHPATRAYIEFSCPTPQEFLRDDL